MEKDRKVVRIGAKRVSVPQAYYKIVTEFILSNLERDPVIALVDLLDAAQRTLQDSIRGDISWYLLGVKQDLVTRKIIRVEWDESRNQHIRLSRQYKQRIAHIDR